MALDPLPQHIRIAGTEPGADKPLPDPPASPRAPYPDEPPTPFPCEPVDAPTKEPERSIPRYDPDPAALPRAAADPVDEAFERVTEKAIEAMERSHRFELAFLAAIISASSALNYLQNAVAKLNAEDWRGNVDLAVNLRRQARELATALDPICAPRAVN